MILTVAAAGVVGAVVGSLSDRTIRTLRPDWMSRLPVVLTAAVTAALWWRFEFDHPAIFVLGWWCAVLCAIDLGCRRLPDLLTGGGAVASGIGVLWAGQGVHGVVGGVALAGMYLAVHVTAPRSFGAGDVKLALSLGVVTGAAGADAWAVAAVLAPIVTGCIGTAFLALGRRQVRVPHGPSMCGATLLALGGVLS